MAATAVPSLWVASPPEKARAEDRQTDGREIIRTDVIETRFASETFRRGRRFLIGRHVCPRPLKCFAQ